MDDKKYLSYTYYSYEEKKLTSTIIFWELNTSHSREYVYHNKRCLFTFGPKKGMYFFEKVYLVKEVIEKWKKKPKLKAGEWKECTQ